MRVLDFAMTVERDAQKLYESLAATATNSDLRRVFTLLAASEEEHLKAMERMLQGGIRFELEKLDRSMSAYAKLMANCDVELKGDADGYQHVIKAEEESIKIYEDLAEQTDKPAVKLLLTELIEQERNHLSIMENIYDFIEQPRSYLESVEFSNMQQL